MVLAPADEPILLLLNDGIGVRKMREEDANSLSRHFNNWNIWVNLRDRVPHPYTEEESKQWIQYNAKSENFMHSGKWTKGGGSQGPAIPTEYAIVINDEPVGGIGLTFGKDVYHRTAELGYWLSEDHWGKGVMSKVVPAFVNWTWKTFDIVIRLNAETNEHNAGSAAVLKKAGFEYEGRRPNMICKSGELMAAINWGALRPT